MSYAASDEEEEDDYEIYQGQYGNQDVVYYEEEYEDGEEEDQEDYNDQDELPANTSSMESPDQIMDSKIRTLQSGGLSTYGVPAPAPRRLSQVVHQQQPQQHGGGGGGKRRPSRGYRHRLK